MSDNTRSMRRRNAEKAEATRRIWSNLRSEGVLLQATIGKHIRELEAENAELREQLVVCRAEARK